MQSSAVGNRLMKQYLSSSINACSTPYEPSWHPSPLAHVVPAAHKNCRLGNPAESAVVDFGALEYLCCEAAHVLAAHYILDVNVSRSSSFEDLSATVEFCPVRGMPSYSCFLKQKYFEPDWKKNMLCFNMQHGGSCSDDTFRPD